MHAGTNNPKNNKSNKRAEHGQNYVMQFNFLELVVLKKTIQFALDIVTENAAHLQCGPHENSFELEEPEIIALEEINKRIW